MNRFSVQLAAAVIALGVTVGAWVMLPSFQDSQQRAFSEAAGHLERARRLLHEYSYGITHKASVLDQLYQAGVDVDLEDEDTLPDSFLDEYQSVHEALWALYKPTDWEASPPRVEQANYGNLERQIDQAVGARKALVSENAELLDQAEREVREAVAAASSDGSAVSLAEPSRLQAVILFHKAETEAVKAGVVRAELPRARQTLADLLPRARELQTFHEELGDSDIDGDLENLQDRLAAIEARLSKYRGQLATVEGRIKSLEVPWRDAIAELSAANRELDRLRAQGVDFSDPQSGDKFEKAVMEQSRRYREAERQASSIEAGGYRDAVLDEPGDYVHGTYVSAETEAKPTIELGLSHYRDERDLLHRQIGDVERSKEFMVSAIAGLKTRKRNNKAELSQADQELATLTERAAKAYDNLNRIESEAFALEETALGLLQQAGHHARDASAATDRWVSQGQTRTQLLSLEARARSPFDQQSKDRWMGAHILSQVAEAHLARAALFYRRFSSATRTADLLTEVSDVLDVREADPDAEHEKIEAAKSAGVEEIVEASELLQRAFRDGGKHWTFVAQQAGANELMALFGFEDYDQDALQAYRNAIKGRETEPFAEPYVERIKHLESR